MKFPEIYMIIKIKVLMEKVIFENKKKLSNNIDIYLINKINV